MRQSRRGCFYQNKEPKYIWKVYDIDTKLNGGTTGSISIRSNRTKMASTEFTYSNGTFTLTNPTSKTITNLSVGDYIVDIRTTTAGANITSGSAIYKVTGKSGRSNITLSYTKYTSMKNIQGSTYYYDVASDTLDYPIDGEQDGYWYVMVKGEKEMYVWDVFDVVTSYTLDTTRTDHVSAGITYYLYKAVFDNSTGLFTITDIYPTQSVTSSLQSIESDDGSVKYYVNGPGSYNGRYWSDQKYSVGDTVSELISFSSSVYCDYPSQARLSVFYKGGLETTSKGNSTGNTVESENSETYPQDGAIDSYWYVYSHCYMKKFDNR